MMLRRFSSRLERHTRFLDARLRGAVAYDRIAGYFRSSGFEIAGEAFEQIEGPIRIVCNSGLDVRDVDVARAIFTEWTEATPEAMSNRQRPRYERLAALLRARRVEIRRWRLASWARIRVRGRTASRSSPLPATTDGCGTGCCDYGNCREQKRRGNANLHF